MFLIHLTFLEPCIAIYFYGKTNQMHNISNLFYFESALYMFRTVLSVHHQQPASGNEMFHLIPARRQLAEPV